MEDVHCRPAGVEDLPFLAAMLGEAAVWRPDRPTPTGDEVMADPRYAMYLTGWPRQGDCGLVAEQDGPVGAAWYRTYTEADHGRGLYDELRWGIAPEVRWRRSSSCERDVVVVRDDPRGGVGVRLLQMWPSTSSVGHAEVLSRAMSLMDAGARSLVAAGGLSGWAWADRQATAGAVSRLV